MKGQPHDHKHLMPTQIIPGSGKTICKQAEAAFSPGLSVKVGPELFLETSHFPFKKLGIGLNHCKKANPSGHLPALGRDDDESKRSVLTDV